MKRIFGLLVSILLTFLLLYTSRFWIWQAPWSNDGLFGIKQLSPRGDVIRQFVRGTDLSVFDLLVWFAFAIFLLSFTQWLYDLIAAKNSDKN